MDAVLRQSKSMCPFLKKTSPATLRSLSTSSPARQASPGGGSMSNLQTIARRCPIMGKALAVQTAKSAGVGLGGVAAIGAIRAFTGKAGKSNTGKAGMHTTRPREARPIEDTLFNRDRGMVTTSSKVFSYPLTA
jgi:5-aminolevulinate synthase